MIEFFSKIYNVIKKYIDLFIIYFNLIKRDISLLFSFVRAQRKLKTFEEDKDNVRVSDIFKKFIKEHPNKPCIIFNEKIWTFKDLEFFSNKIANIFADKFNLKKNDVVALFMENKPEYVGIWYGLSKIGVITSLVNTNLRSKILIDSIELVKPVIFIYGSELDDAFDEIKNDLNREIITIRQKNIEENQENKNNQKPNKNAMFHLESLTVNVSDVFIEKEKFSCQDTLIYVYTSGTTGLPKAALIKHSRYIGASYMFFKLSGLTKNDIFLVNLPLYHSNGGMVGIGMALISGITVVLRRKFSASNFWHECIEYKCTAFCYVGEICRYLINQPESPFDKKHSVRLCIGNGMRSNIHEKFSKRFNIKCIEFYGSTEGNCAFINVDGKYGACGFIPLINRLLNVFPSYIIKVDDNKEPIRDLNGFCIKCNVNETGLLVGLINDKIPKLQFNGYANNQNETNKKIINNLFKKNQRGYNTGDLMVCDQYGWLYFVDRIGDTFRWRGENVSCTEVENIISSHLNSLEVCVYGVEINGLEGRAGMVTILSFDIDLQELKIYMQKSLPSYAIPIFIRLSKQIDHTGTFKAQKKRLVSESYNINLTDDSIFYFDKVKDCYIKITNDLYEKIQNGFIKF